jgi:hypothetical protein
MTAKMIEVGSEPVRLDIQAEPIACRLDVIMGSQAVNFTLGLTGPAGERLRVDGPGVKRDNLPSRPLSCTTATAVFLRPMTLSPNAAAIFD